MKTSLKLAMAAVFALFAGGLVAQVEQFNSTTLPTGWSYTSGGNNQWAIDANGTQKQYYTGSFTPYSSGPFSLNFNDGTDMWPGTSSGGSGSSGGVRTGTYDLSYAPNPELKFQSFYEGYYYAYYGMAAEVRIWDSTFSTLIHSFPIMTATISNPSGFSLQTLQLDQQWGQVRIEFYASSGTYYYYPDRNTGWFVDDVEFSGFTPPSLGIDQSSPLTSGTVGTAISTITFTATYGSTPYTQWQIINGATPVGLTFTDNGTNATLSGTPTVSGKYGFTLRVTDSASNTATRFFIMRINRNGVPSGNYSIPFEDDFFQDKGWTYDSGGGWERGYALTHNPGPSTNNGNPDPANDTTSSTDNFIMGVNIGGNWPTSATMNQYYYATSPPIDASSYRTLEFQFKRWNNGYYYYIPARVEYKNSSGSWVSLWNQTYNDSYDASWQTPSYDIDFGVGQTGPTNFQVRFGWRYTNSSSGYHSGGFHVDDVRIIEKPQPGIVEITRLEVISSASAGSTPKCFINNDYLVELELDNNSTNPVDITSLNYTFHLGGTPQNVGTLNFVTSPSVSSPVTVPGSASSWDWPPYSATQPWAITFQCTGLGQYGAGTSVILNVELIGKENGGLNRAIIANSQTDPSGDETVTIDTQPTVTITDSNPIPDASMNAQYNYAFSAQYGQTPYTWSITGLPSWLTANGNQISGTPTTATVPSPPQQFQFTVTVTDSTTPTAQQDQKQYTVTVVNNGPQALQIVTQSQLPNATEGTSYSPTVIQALGGTPPYSWSQIGGALPSGMSFNPSTQEISGQPGGGTAGSYSVTIRVQDSAGTPAQKDRTFYLSVLPATLSVTIITPSTGTGSPPNGLETDPYNGGTPFQFQAQGGYQPYIWTINSGNFPDGLVLDPDTGEVTGVPTTSGTYNFQVRCSDGAFPPVLAFKDFSVYVDALVPSPLAITTSDPLPAGAEGNFYSVTLDAANGPGPYSWTVSNGALPAGLGLDAQSGNIAGYINISQVTPPSQDFVFTVEVTDSTQPTAQVATKQFTMTVDAFQSGPLTITTPDPLMQGGIGSPYNQAMKATGGAPANPAVPYFWIALQTNDDLPNGLTLDPATGVISGVPQPGTDGIYYIDIQAEDGNGGNDVKTFELQINGYGGGPGGGNNTEIRVKKRRTETKPFWEACSASTTAGSWTLALLALMAGFALYRRRRA